MSDEKPDDAQKTEEPTPKKLQESRKKGQVPLSREVNHWMMLFAGTMMIAFFFGPMLYQLGQVMQAYLERASAWPYAPGGLHIVLGDAFKEVMTAMALPLMFLFFMAFIGPFSQVGPLFTTEPMKPKMDKISPIKGFSRIFSMKSIMEFVKGIFKLAVVSVVAFVILYPYFDQLEHMIGKPMMVLLEELQILALRMMIGILVAFIVIAVIDLAFQRQQHHKEMRMTKQEVKDEYKQSEGDPHVKSRLRQLRMERGRQRMMANVPQADVVITNPTHFSIALKYNPEEMDAPVCVAKGIDDVALRIREMAKEHDIILYENKPLARSLYDVVEIDEMIPADYYKAVAEVISFVFQKQGRST